MIPLCRPSMTDREKKLVIEVLESGWLAHGPKTKEFEEKFAKYIGTKYAVSLNSCTSALFLAAIGKDLKGEVIIPSFTFVASANAVKTAGCTPILADIDYDTCNIDVESMEKCISDKTSAIMPVHYGGQACDMDRVMEIAEEKGLVVIEDSAETLGGTYKGRMTGGFGIGCFSFYPTKNITTGEGGMVTTNDDDLAGKIATLKGHGIPSSTWAREKKPQPWIRDAILPGYNFRMSDVLAALGVVQMERLDAMNDARRKHAAFLSKELAGIEQLDLPVESNGCKHVWQMYTVKVKGLDRNAFVAKLVERGVGASVHFDPAVHQSKAYSDAMFRRVPLDVTDKVSKSIVTLPMFPDLTQNDLEHMVTAVEDTVRELKK